MSIPKSVRIILLLLFFLFFLSLGVFVARNYVKSSEVMVFPNDETTHNEAQNELHENESIEVSDEEILLNSKQSEKQALTNTREAKNPSDTSTNFNVLILGIDRRHGNQAQWRTDVIQLLTLSPSRDKAVITHIPRDVWADTYKINAIYNLQGPEAIKDQIEKVTGQRPDRIIRIDFDAFVWLIDSVGGLTIDVPTAFIDSQYPLDREGSNEATTVEFKAGPQTMDGETALIYARSRKGTNGEGSDYARGRRQQLIMRSFIDDLFQPENLFNPKTAEAFYNIATQKVYTDMNLADAKVLFEVLKNYKIITVRTLSLDTSNYLYVPPSDLYGKQWVLEAKNNDYTPVHNELNTLLQ